MDFIFELILELVLEGSIEASKSKKVPKPIRYLLIILISLFFISVAGLIIWVGIDSIKSNLVGGILVIGFGIVFFILCILEFKKAYIKKKNKKNKT